MIRRDRAAGAEQQLWRGDQLSDDRIQGDLAKMVAGNVAANHGDDQLQEVLLQNIAHLGDHGSNLGAGISTAAKRSRTRDVASRYKSATISSANAAAITSQRYQSPRRGCRYLGRSASCLNESSVPKQTASSALEKRPVSAERRRPSAENKTSNRTSTTISSQHLDPKTFLGRPYDGLCPSTNSLSSSLQSHTSINGVAENKLEAQIDHTLQPSTQNGAHKASISAMDLQIRRRTPLRPQTGSDQMENSKPFENLSARIEHHRWPATSNNAKAFMSRSMDLSLQKQQRCLSRVASLILIPSRYRNGSKADMKSNDRNLSRSVNEESVTIHSKSDDFRNCEIDELAPKSGRSDHTNAWKPLQQQQQESADEEECGSHGSDTESTSSGSWQDRRIKLASTITSNSMRSFTSIRVSQSGSSTPQSPRSPTNSFRSPTKTRAVQPVFLRQLSLNGHRNNVARLLNLNLDVRKSLKGMSQQEETHDLRLMHNRWLQWRFVNARVKLTIKAQTAAVESLLFNVCSRICDLRMLVATKQAQRNKIRDDLKLDSVLRSHAAQLEEWETLKSEHSSALTGFVKALEAAVVRLPLIGGPNVCLLAYTLLNFAKVVSYHHIFLPTHIVKRPYYVCAVSLEHRPRRFCLDSVSFPLQIDVQTMKEILFFATDMMNAIDASVNKFLPKAELADCLLSELAKTMVVLKASLEECGELLAVAAALETEECSLRMHLIQLEQLRVRSLESKRPAFTNAIIVH